MNHLESSFSGQNAFWRYFIMVAALFAATNTVGAIPLLIAMGMKSAANPLVISQLAENPNDLSVLGLDPNIYLLTMIFPFLIGLGTFILLIRPLNGRSFFQVVNGGNSFRWNRFLISGLVWTIVSAIYLVVSIKVDDTNFIINNKSLSLIPLIIISVLLIPFQAAFEEILFRGYLMQGFAVLVKSRWFPLLMTSILFALMHILNPEVKDFGFWTMMPQYLLFGLIFGVITVLDDGIEAALGAHAANNVFLCILITNESSTLQTPALYKQLEINPWFDLLLMLLMGILVILILKKIFRWSSFSVLVNKIENKPVMSQIP
jgi:membrane protease YdiL (CAAX protease family)